MEVRLSKIKNHFARQPLTMLGSVAFLLGSGCHWFLHPNSFLSGNMVDGVTGLFFGVSIASMLLSLKSRPKMLCC
jgi:hypothetical protein